MPTVSPEEMQAAQIITGVAVVAFLLSGRMGPRAPQIRAAVLGVYLVAAIGLVGYVMLR